MQNADRDLYNRAVKNFKVEVRNHPDGRCVITVCSLGGAVIDRIEAVNHTEAERELAALGYERMPPYVASDIDRATRERDASCGSHHKVHHEVQ